MKVVEGKGYCARRQERRSLKKLGEFVENKDKIVVVPEIPENGKKKSDSSKV